VKVVEKPTPIIGVLPALAALHAYINKFMRALGRHHLDRYANYSFELVKCEKNKLKVRSFKNPIVLNWK
jgi:hypothetical protein